MGEVEREIVSRTKMKERKSNRYTCKCVYLIFSLSLSY